MQDLNARQSDLIKAMRFPLIVLVLYVHSAEPNHSLMTWSPDGANVFHIFTEVFSHYIGGLALCWFFFFSGFLFFLNLKDGQFGKQWVEQKWLRRVKSVLVPFLIWNLLNVLAILLVTFLFKKAGVDADMEQMERVRRGPLFWFITGPIDQPLWYLRNLCVLSLLAPLFYYPVKKYPWITLAVLMALYFATFFGVRFFLLPCIVFFGMGAWMGIRRDNLVGFCYKYRYPAAVLAVMLLIATALMYNAGWDNPFFLLFAPFGMVTFLNFCHWLYKFNHVRKLLLRLTETVFFIYASHEIYLMGWTKGLFLRLLGDALWAKWVSYLFVPVVTLGICLALFYLIKLIMPKVLSALCGWRTIHQFNKHPELDK